MLVLLFLSVAGAQLPNDLCSGAINVTDGQHVGSNIGVPVPTYAQRADCLYSSDVYYVYYATCRGKVTISALGDTTSGLYLAAFAGNCAGLGPCVRDSSGTYTPASIDVLSSAIGDKIYFGLGSAVDTFKFNITCSSQGVAAGDRCPNALPYTSPYLMFSTTNVSAEQQFGGGSCLGNDVFILYNATCDGDATATVESSGYRYLAVFYPGTCNEIVGNDWQRSCTTGSDTFPVRANHLYYLAVGGSEDYDYNVSITCAAVARPVNDDCAGAISVTSPFTFDTTSPTGATRSVPRELCYYFDSDVWFSYNATCNGDLWLQFNGSAYAIAYAGSSCDAVLASDCVYGEYEFKFPVWMGQTYRIGLAGYSSYYAIEANFTCLPQTRPTNDKCVNATPTGTNVSHVVDPRTATTESSVRALSCERDLVNDVYFLYTTCAGTNTISVDYNGSITNVALAAFLGCGLEPIACTGFATSFAVPIALPILIGVGFGNSVGYAQVNFSCIPFPPTDAPTPQPTAPTTAQPTAQPTAPTTATPTAKPTATPTVDNTTDTNTTDTTAPTLSGAKTLQLGLASLLGCAMLA